MLYYYYYYYAQLATWKYNSYKARIIPRMDINDKHDIRISTFAVFVKTYVYWSWSTVSRSIYSMGSERGLNSGLGYEWKELAKFDFAARENLTRNRFVAQLMNGNCCVRWLSMLLAVLSAGSHRARRIASHRVDATTFGLLASNVCIFIKLSITSLSFMSLSMTSMSTDVVWWWSPIATRTFWPFIVIWSPLAYHAWLKLTSLIGCMQISWRASKRVDVRWRALMRSVWTGL